ncbi:Uncharacterized protein GBIM_18346, partial [Gryllus bimaculatus]
MEAETLASRVRASQLQTELGSLVAAKRDLEEQLRVAVSQKSELNARIHDLHLQFVSGRAAANANANANAHGPLSHSSGASSSVASSSVSAASYSPLTTELATRSVLPPALKYAGFVLCRVVRRPATSQVLDNSISSYGDYFFLDFVTKKENANRVVK